MKKTFIKPIVIMIKLESETLIAESSPDSIEEIPRGEQGNPDDYADSRGYTESIWEELEWR